MTKSQEAYKRAEEAGQIDKKEFIKFKETGLHVLKFIEDQEVNGKNFETHEPEEKMRYIFDENGERKLYETALFKFVKDKKTGKMVKKLSSFVESMNNLEYGDTFKAEWTPIKGTDRGFIKIDKMNLKEGEEEEERGEEEETNVGGIPT